MSCSKIAINKVNSYHKSFIFLIVKIIHVSVRETYPLELCKHELPVLDQDRIKQILSSAKENDTIKKGKHILTH